jgi:hypothetical protein
MPQAQSPLAVFIMKNLQQIGNDKEPIKRQTLPSLLSPQLEAHIPSPLAVCSTLPMPMLTNFLLKILNLVMRKRMNITLVNEQK